MGFRNGTRVRRMADRRAISGSTCNVLALGGPSATTFPISPCPRPSAPPVQRWSRGDSWRGPALLGGPCEATAEPRRPRDLRPYRDPAPTSTLATSDGEKSLIAVHGASERGSHGDRRESHLNGRMHRCVLCFDPAPTVRPWTFPAASARWELPVSGPPRQRHPGRKPTGEGRESSRERRHRLLRETDSVLTAITDLLTAHQCHPGRD